ncbi:glycosyltransferase [Enterococcus pseudoavium]|uniref:Glycosyltransferase n=1 Tax=Enterococcus pseudoavium TaxID=44007 RepID=A0AAE4I3D4_9ENTE|nr:glycosyltransferase [Enterococcus pseudoavium]MDT2737235.1 glycosyltransferase [Enterococcus pseudoavium]
MISIIVPIFNAEKTLQRCLDSIKAQTYSDLEIILVNDGSKDNSLDICKRFAKEDDRFIIITQENLGAGKARNAGLRKAKGSYIGFVDSDDLIMPDMYEVLISNLIDMKAEISAVRLSHFYDNDGNLDIKQCTSNRSKPRLLNTKQALKEVLNGTNYGTHSVTKLFKKEIFNDIYFPDSSYGEDSSLIIDLFLKANYVVFEDTIMYYYIHNGQSSTEQFFNPKMFDIINTWEKNEKKINRVFPDLDVDIHSRVCWAYFSVLDLMIKSNVENNYTETKNIIRFLKKNMMFIIMKSNLTISRKVSGIGLLFNLNLYRLFTKLKLKIRK